MTTESLLHEIGQIDDDIIIEADTIQPRVTGLVRFPWKMGMAAACIAVIVSVIVFYTRAVPPAPREYPNLPMLTVDSEIDGTFGFEGYFAYHIDELANGNPWTENADIDTLPVFKNTILYDGAGRPVNGGLSVEEMTQKVIETAAALGVTVDSIYTIPKAEDVLAEKKKEQSNAGNKDVEPDTTPYEVVAVCGDVEIMVEPNGHVRISFESGSGAALPEEYNFHGSHETEQQAESATQYLLEQYAAVVAMDSPALSVFGHYNIYGDRSFFHRAYESGDSLVESILGYNFNQVSFASNEKNQLWIMRLYQYDISQKLGDYPIITAKEARKLLIQGHYISNAPYTIGTEQFPGKKYIARVELVYRKGRHDEVFMPYYRFLVELPTEQRDNGLKNYGAFYVPAVDGRYLDN